MVAGKSHPSLQSSITGADTNRDDQLTSSHPTKDDLPGSARPSATWESDGLLEFGFRESNCTSRVMIILQERAEKSSQMLDDVFWSPYDN